MGGGNNTKANWFYIWVMGNKKWLVIGLVVLSVVGVILYLKNENDTKKNIEDIENEKKEFERKKRERQYEFTKDSLELERKRYLERAK